MELGTGPEFWVGPIDASSAQPGGTSSEPKNQPMPAIDISPLRPQRLAAIRRQQERERAISGASLGQKRTPTTPGMEAVASRPLLLVFSSTRINDSQTHRRFFPTRRPIHNPHVSNTIRGYSVSPLWCTMCNFSGRTKCLKAIKCAEGTFACCGINILKIISWREKFKHNISIIFVRLVTGIMLFILVSLIVSKTASAALTEENLLFLEAWRTVDRAYYDKTFNGQSWFRYRENALQNEPMNTREETYMAIRKMLSTLDDPFTRFLEPEKFKSLRSGTQGALTGVGLSIGYPMMLNGSATGLVVISSSPGGPANKAGIVPGDVVLAIDDTSTEDMDIYDAADRLQGAEGSSVKLAIRSGSEIRNLVLKREKVTLNPVKSRLCEITGSGMDGFRIGYIKLTSFNQNASGAIKDAIETLRNNNVKAFVLDLRDNSGGLFPEGIEIAKIWLEKGVIVYICDSRGIRDIYEADGSNTIAASEPLAVLVNRGTASASEILAGALKDNKRAVLYGEPTFGKGKIQSVFELSDGSGLAVTVARYETPAHTDINKVGILPDHTLPTSFPVDEDGFCACLKDPASLCSLNGAELFTGLHVQKKT